MLDAPRPPRPAHPCGLIAVLASAPAFLLLFLLHSTFSHGYASTLRHADSLISPAQAAAPTPAQAAALLQRVKSEPFTIDSERRLRNHPYVVAAEQGTLTRAQRRAFAGEQYAIQASDARSFAALHGHPNFRPKSLASASLPPPVRSGRDGSDELFQALLSGELYAARLLLDMAAAVGFPNERSLREYNVSARAQGYPSYWGRLALSQMRAAGAAAAAVNFDAFGAMCGRVRAALASGRYKDVSEKELAFLEYFAEPIEGLGRMAEAVLAEGPVDYEEVRTAVRLLQDYEVLFWDAIYAAK